MPKSSKTFRKALEGQLIDELLNCKSKIIEEADGAEFDPNKPRTLGERLKLARRLLAETVMEANIHLEESMVAQHLAEALAVEENKRGYPGIVIQPTGDAMLEVSYDPKRRKGKRRTYKTTLPLLDELRKRAVELGVDISHLGAKRRAIHDYLQEIEGRKTKDTDPGGPDGEPEKEMGAGPDEVSISPPKSGPKPPKRRAVVRAKPTVVTPGATPADPESEEAPKGSPNLKNILKEGEDMDIESLLDSDKSLS